MTTVSRSHAVTAPRDLARAVDHRGAARRGDPVRKGEGIDACMEEPGDQPGLRMACRVAGCAGVVRASRIAAGLLKSVPTPGIIEDLADVERRTAPTN